MPAAFIEPRPLASSEHEPINHYVIIANGKEFVEISEKVYQGFVAKYTTWEETYKLVQI